jgi:uncharacterized heparinase superfamily protein
VHHRELQVSSQDGALSGRDRFVDRRGEPWSGKASVMLRFHIHPAVTANLAEAEGGVRLDLPGGRSWLFETGGASVSLAESVHLANPDGPRRTMQIMVGPLTSSEIAWTIAPLARPEESPRSADI